MPLLRKQHLTCEHQKLHSAVDKTAHVLFAMNRVFIMNNGLKMPVIGLGTYKSKPGEVEQAVQDAIEVGYRHLDCAWFYDNEAEVGLGITAKIKDGTVKRKDLFITTKLWNNYHEKHLVLPKLKESLQNLQVDYVDLFLMHYPMGFKETAPLLPVNEGPAAYSDTDYIETWQAMEESVDLGLAKSIGVSNFNSFQLNRVINKSRIKPAVNQFEINPNIQQKKLIKFCTDHNVVVTGYCPLGRISQIGSPGFPTPTILDPNIIKMGQKYGKTPAQIVLNFLVTLEIVVIPKSVTKSRIIENSQIFDFTLSPEDVEYLKACDKHQRVTTQHAFADHQYYPFSAEF